MASRIESGADAPLAAAAVALSVFQPILESLPPAQRRLWPELRRVPTHFVLYGGTAIALRLAHRQSVDFDFFTAVAFEPEGLQRQLNWGAELEVLQKSENTLSLRVGSPGVRVSFFGGLSFGQVEPADQCADNGIYVAGLRDLMATKLNTIYQRAESKDYLDVEALLRAGHSLTLGLAWARAIYGSAFNAMLPLKALAFYEDGDLPSLPREVKLRLTQAVEAAGEIPEVRAHSDRIETAQGNPSP